MLEHVTVRLGWTHVDTDAIEFVLRMLIAVSWLKRRLKVKEAIVTRDDMSLRALEEALWEVPVIEFGVKEINPDFMFTADELYENFGKAQSLSDSELARLWDLWRRKKQDRSREAVRSIFHKDLDASTHLDLDKTVHWLHMQVRAMAMAAITKAQSNARDADPVGMRLVANELALTARRLDDADRILHMNKGLLAEQLDSLDDASLAVPNGGKEENTMANLMDAKEDRPLNDQEKVTDERIMKIMAKIKDLATKQEQWKDIAMDGGHLPPVYLGPHEQPMHTLTYHAERALPQLVSNNAVERIQRERASSSRAEQENTDSVQKDQHRRASSSSAERVSSRCAEGEQGSPRTQQNRGRRDSTSSFVSTGTHESRRRDSGDSRRRRRKADRDCHNIERAIDQSSGREKKTNNSDKEGTISQTSRSSRRESSRGSGSEKLQRQLSELKVVRKSLKVDVPSILEPTTSTADTAPPKPETVPPPLQSQVAVHARQERGQVEEDWDGEWEGDPFADDMDWNETESWHFDDVAWAAEVGVAYNQAQGPSWAPIVLVADPPGWTAPPLPTRGIDEMPLAFLARDGHRLCANLCADLEVTDGYGVCQCGFPESRHYSPFELCRGFVDADSGGRLCATCGTDNFQHFMVLVD